MTRDCWISVKVYEIPLYCSLFASLSNVTSVRLSSKSGIPDDLNQNKQKSQIVHVPQIIHPGHDKNIFAVDDPEYQSPSRPFDGARLVEELGLLSNELSKKKCGDWSTPWLFWCLPEKPAFKTACRGQGLQDCVRGKFFLRFCKFAANFQFCPAFSSQQTLRYFTV